MDNDKVYFALSLRYNLNYVANNGFVFTNFNLYNFLSKIWNKYNAFNLKVETSSPTTNNGVPYCLHMSGLQWINGYDSISPNYTDSRVLETIYSNNGGATGTSYISNTNAISFYKPSSFNTNFVFFWTDLDSNLLYIPSTFYLNTIVFSVTGIDAYKIQHPSKGLRYNVQNKLSSILSLNYYDGVSIDPVDSTVVKGRIRKFSNINLRNIIGNEIYDKYNKFALVTRRIVTDMTGVGIPWGIGNFWYQLWLSSNNICFENPSYDSSNIQGTITEAFSNPVMIGFYNMNWVELYIQNVFTKPSGSTTDLTIHFSGLTYVSLPGANTSTNDLFPNMQFIFEIIPIKD